MNESHLTIEWHTTQLHPWMNFLSSSNDICLWIAFHPPCIVMVCILQISCYKLPLELFWDGRIWSNILTCVYIFNNFYKFKSVKWNPYDSQEFNFFGEFMSNFFCNGLSVFICMALSHKKMNQHFNVKHSWSFFEVYIGVAHLPQDWLHRIS
jgi:hypothetical protein